MTCENCQRREALDGHLLCGPCAAAEIDSWADEPYDDEEDE